MPHWNFQRAHSILHKVQEIIMFGWTENFSTKVNNMLSIILYHCSVMELACTLLQGPKHCHIRCTNNKDVFLNIMTWHVHDGHIQYLWNLQVNVIFYAKSCVKWHNIFYLYYIAYNMLKYLLYCYVLYTILQYMSYYIVYYIVHFMLYKT